MKRITIFALLSLALSLPCYAQTPTPPPAPSPSPTPAYCSEIPTFGELVQAFADTGVGTHDGVLFYAPADNPVYAARFGKTTADVYSAGTTYSPKKPMAVVNDYGWVFAAGSRIKFDYDGVNDKYIYFPADDGSTPITYYVGGNGVTDRGFSTYSDRWLCQTAWDGTVGKPTPSPTATASPTPSRTPTPSPTATASPSPSPTAYSAPCEGRSWFSATSITAAKIGTTRGSGVTSLRYMLFSATDSYFGVIYDRQNVWGTDGAVAEAVAESVKLRIYSLTTTTTQSGDWIAFTSGGGLAVKTYIPAATWGAGTQVDLWIASDGGTYNDRFLCDQAQAATTPSPSPTPYVGMCLEYSEIPLTSDQTSIFAELNTTFGELWAVLNGGIDSNCFKPDFSIGAGHIGANAITNTQMGDYAIALDNMQTGAADSRVVLNGSLTDFDNQTTCTHDGHFEIRNQVTFTKNSSPDTTAFRFSVKNPTDTEKASDTCNLYLTATAEDGTTTWPYVVERDTGYVGFSGMTEPTAAIDVFGSVRIRESLILDKGLSGGWTSFAVNSTVPHIGDHLNYRTYNTAPTLIKDLDGGANGQHIWVLHLDDQTAYSTLSTSKMMVSWVTDTEGANFDRRSWAEYTNPGDAGLYGWTATTEVLVSWVKRGDYWYMGDGYGYRPKTDFAVQSSTGTAVYDRFATSDLSGGAGWSGSWNKINEAKIVSEGKDGGPYAMRLGSNKGMYRVVDAAVTGSRVISCYYTATTDLGSFYIEARPTGGTWSILTTVTVAGPAGSWYPASATVDLTTNREVGFLGITKYTKIDEIEIK